MPKTKKDVAKLATEARENELLGMASQAKYEQRYTGLISYMRTLRRIRAKDPKPSEDDVCLYLDHLRKERSFAPKTLWSAYSMIGKILQVRHSVDIKLWKRIVDQLKKYEREGGAVKKAGTFPQKVIQEKFAIPADPTDHEWVRNLCVGKHGLLKQAVSHTVVSYVSTVSTTH
ncbi:hypothetical protein DIPPA_23813 [Diplonema papillatum]|nr:hypothetical protein DIPPA_23813 [Diplonema papillatum]